MRLVLPQITFSHWFSDVRDRRKPWVNLKVQTDLAYWNGEWRSMVSSAKSIQLLCEIQQEVSNIVTPSGNLKIKTRLTGGQIASISPLVACCTLQWLKCFNISANAMCNAKSGLAVSPLTV